jgi:F-type H+-transporting ATPase subunit epsilon
MVAALKPGLLRYKVAGIETMMFVAGGFAEVRDNTVRVLTSAGEEPEKIDAERARAALDRARRRLSGSQVTDTGEPIDMIRAEAALKRALMRLSARGLGGGR